MTKKSKDQKITVAELFAGVGGFRLGLEGYKGKSATSHYKRKLKNRFRTVWSNQYEPSKNVQHASMIYTLRFGKSGHSNKDISTIPASEIPDHTMMVAGFPCQDFSIANRLNRSAGLNGKKGVLWWQIHRILKAKIDSGTPTEFLLFENVDRLLTSRDGCDFYSIISSLNDLGYALEWRVINAAQYGFPQRRKRVFILACHKNSKLYQPILQAFADEWLARNGIIANAFPIQDNPKFKSFRLGEVTLSKARRTFENAGMMVNGLVTTGKVAPNYEGPLRDLESVLQDDKEVPSKFFITKEQLKKWRVCKGAKTIERVQKDGTTYTYTEGSCTFPDPVNKPSRTIITSEGSSTPYRTSHVVRHNSKRHRRLLPIELERLNLFPDNFTAGLSDPQRGFLMGNALVIGIVERIGAELATRVND